MKVTIITVVFNGVKTIDSCIKSILDQTYPLIEYIIIDGQSSDGTQQIIQSYGTQITHFISEPDRGIYDAMNKGLNLASGDVIGILNADDFYSDAKVVADVVRSMTESRAQACYGDLEYVDEADTSKVKRRWIAGEYKAQSFLYGWMPPHPTFFISAKCYKDYGHFRLDLGSAADYELMLRMIHKFQVKTTYLPRVLVKMRTGGVSNSSVGNRWKANRNDQKAWHVNGMKPKFFTLLMKPLRKISQFI